MRSFIHSNGSIIDVSQQSSRLTTPVHAAAAPAPSPLFASSAEYQPFKTVLGPVPAVEPSNIFAQPRPPSAKFPAHYFTSRISDHLYSVLHDSSTLLETDYDFFPQSGFSNDPLQFLPYSQPDPLLDTAPDYSSPISLDDNQNHDFLIGSILANAIENQPANCITAASLFNPTRVTAEKLSSRSLVVKVSTTKGLPTADQQPQRPSHLDSLQTQSLTQSQLRQEPREHKSQNDCIDMRIIRARPIRSFPSYIPIRHEFPRFYNQFPRLEESKPPSRYDSYTQYPNTDIYSPRYTRGVANGKEALCPICAVAAESGGESRYVWLKTKCSAYWYHMNFYHGVSSLTKMPVSPPIAFKSYPLSPEVLGKSYASSSEAIYALHGKCHECLQWVALEKQKAGTHYTVPELLWFQHAKKCHTTRIDGEGLELIAPGSVDVTHVI
ncbi:hypothetical protein CANCADRAFT_32862 [Tortispora caseinolytica NRRL Y-17796]|uniref:Transcription regulator Rua1 C-terminal domain-containing protein n=1 Tax=Tortispora caseinolytica NRRL Y-17796 TaxID=767744 RepID=A0A1E4TD87_9ASCO|nr:hypothetical protein CANCADRAFT_32862 [Tortispora caseinolytica NRRL Y-17796]